MNTRLMHTMIAAAALLVAAGSASAQTYKADVPVTFHVGNKLMPAGPYDVRLTNNSAVIRNRITGNVALVVSAIKADPPKNWIASGDPRISFECTDSVCSLGKVWNGADSFAYLFSTPKAPAGDLVARTHVITLSMIHVR